MAQASFYWLLEAELRCSVAFWPVDASTLPFAGMASIESGDVLDSAPFSAECNLT